MTGPWGAARADRYWCVRDAAVQVDDDGFLSDPAGEWGRAVNPHVVTVDALFQPRCVVIIGEPGTGKSETIRLHAPLLGDRSPMPVVRVDLAEFGSEDRLARALFDHPDVVAWRSHGSGEVCVLLDSLDECQERVSHVATVLGHELARWPTERLHLRICCRTGDWPESLQQQLEHLFPDVHVFELLPLTRASVAALAEEAGVRGSEFLSAVRAAHAGPLAAKPLTLEMLLRLYQRDGRLPDDVSGLYREALLLLSEEPAQRRRDGHAPRRLSAVDRVSIAARLAAVSTFGHRVAFWTGRPDERPDTDLAVRECAGSTEPGAVGAVAVSEDAVRETLRTGLFGSRGAARVGWAHHTFAEHLTARFLIAHQLHQKQLRSLLVAADGQVYPQLRPVAAWLLALSAGEFDWLAEQDPELLLTAPVDVPRPQLRQRAVAGLFRLAAAGDYHNRFGHRFDGLDYPGLDATVRSHLRTGTPEQRRLALDLAGDCALPALREDLVTIVLDDSEEYRVRISAAHALATITKHVPTTELRTRAREPSRDDDPDDQLKGYALRLSWPHVLSSAEVFPALTAPRRSNLLGAYAMFVEYEFPDALTVADVDAGLDWLLAIERAGKRHDRFDRLADRVVTLALDALDEGSVADRLAQLAVLRAHAHEPLFVDRITRDPKPMLTPDQRHRIIEAALEYVAPDNAIALMDHSAYGPCLVTRDDLQWLIEQFDANPSRRDVLSRLIEWIFHPTVPGHAQFALELSEDHPLRAGALRYWVTPVDLTSKQAEQARRRHVMMRGDDDTESERPPLTDAEVEEKIRRWLDRFDDGDPAGFWQACFLLYLRPRERTIQIGDEYDPDLTAQPRWAILTEQLRGRLVAAARAYLDVGDCAADAWLGTRTLHRPAYAGYRALVVLRRLDPDALSTLPASVWQRWAPIVLASDTAHGAGRWDDKKALLDLARAHAEDELFTSAVAMIDGDSARGERIARDRELAVIWSPRLAAWLRDCITAGRLNERAATDATVLLAQHDADGARQLLQTVLNDDPDEDRRARAGALLLAHDAQASWPVLYQKLRDDPHLGKRIASEYVAGVRYREDPPTLADGDLADLYVWLVRQFPFEEDPDYDDVHVVGPREQIAHWRDGILRSLQNRGTATAVHAIAVIEAALPVYRWLRSVRRDAELQLRANAWAPVEPGDLLDLVADADRRVVNTTAELLDVVLDALTTIQTRLTGETPESQLLWDTRSRRPKTEDEISDYLRNRLDDLLVARHVIISREVQVRRSGRGIGERTDLRVDAVAENTTAAPSVLTVVIEVKGAWNPDLLEDSDRQLVNRYMRDIGTPHGIYLVAWPDVESWGPAGADKRRVATRQGSTTREDLERQAANLAGNGAQVAVVHLDIALARPGLGP